MPPIKLLCEETTQHLLFRVLSISLVFISCFSDFFPGIKYRNVLYVDSQMLNFTPVNPCEARFRKEQQQSQAMMGAKGYTSVPMGRKPGRERNLEERRIIKSSG